MLLSRPELAAAIRKRLLDFAALHINVQSLRQQNPNSAYISELLKQLLAQDGLGLSLLAIPAEFGGLSDCCGFALCSAAEFLGGLDLGLASGLLATFLAAYPAFESGTDAQKQNMAKLLKSGAIGSFAATEAQGGGFPFGVLTKASIINNAGAKAYKLNGAKQWITNAPIADFYLILAKAPEGPAWFLIEKNSPGIAIGLPEPKCGQHSALVASIYLDNVMALPSSLIGCKLGCGLSQAQAALSNSRAITAALAIGAGEAALCGALDYAAQAPHLWQSDSYINSLITLPYSKLEAARFYLLRLKGFAYKKIFENANASSAIIKFFASRACFNSCLSATRALGAFGISRNCQASFRLEDSRILNIYEGADEVLQLLACRGRWQEFLRSGGSLYEDKSAALSASGGQEAASAMLRVISGVFKLCRKFKLTRNAFSALELGRLCAIAEIASNFSLMASAMTAEEGKRFMALGIFPENIGSAECEAALSRIFLNSAFGDIIASAPRILSDFRCDLSFISKESAFFFASARGLAEDFALIKSALKMKAFSEKICK